jgi:hypothetical protein
MFFARKKCWRAVAASRAGNLSHVVPGADAPGFMLSPAPQATVGLMRGAKKSWPGVNEKVFEKVKQNPVSGVFILERAKKVKRDRGFLH